MTSPESRPIRPRPGRAHRALRAPRPGPRRSAGRRAGASWRSPRGPTWRWRSTAPRASRWSGSRPRPTAVRSSRSVTDDMPFLVAALLAAITRAGGEVRRVLHPIVVVRRAPDGKLAEVLTRADPDAPPPDTLAESWTRLELAPLAVRARGAGGEAHRRAARRARDRRRRRADARARPRDRRCARRPTGAPRRHPARPTSRRCCAGSSTATSRSSATATTSPGRTAPCSPTPRPGSACCATAPAAPTSAPSPTSPAAAANRW